MGSPSVHTLQTPKNLNLQFGVSPVWRDQQPGMSANQKPRWGQLTNERPGWCEPLECDHWDELTVARGRG